ncbi:putative fatty acyl-CoA reductase CG5065 isoform X1 [Eurytemora carolleeae]|uniref:putative fatty acyl-CoA reductase CG5065 isoform X1 n=1 Tax=Eurytemora carolleeae TaxID=1294199 RepID=UPI000C77804F|nr:putative fatty acyl-CoA reductase CG5065 isoform X1 [Eurytemora carolleeae]|eukprot:XP_023328796.1 putative fatty acyl-CoA reductase CG5065 isoform X1 [Eurytemora affinis]
MSQNFDEVTAGSPVAQFYENRVIFITGSTGFMGKVLVEKLLRSTSVKKIYLLIRQKKGVATQARLQDLLSSKLFDRLLVENVSVVFHSAATVKFDEDLTKSVAMNVESVQSMISLCKKMKKLEALVHVSTAYCNCDRSEIKEEVYPPPGNPQGFIQLCKCMDEETLNSPEMTAKLIGNRPNTYTFTKVIDLIPTAPPLPR